MKTQLSLILESQTPATKNWIQFLDSLVEQHNAQPAGKTSLSRNDVTDSNFLDYLDERFGGTKASDYDCTAQFSSASLDSRVLSKSVKSRIFKHLPGDRVIVTRRSLNLMDDQSTAKSSMLFSKPSVSGNFSKIPFVVQSAKLRVTSDRTWIAGERDGNLKESGDNCFLFFSFFHPQFTNLKERAPTSRRGHFSTTAKLLPLLSKNEFLSLPLAPLLDRLLYARIFKGGGGFPH